MKTNAAVTTKKRILSVFMAFLIFALALPMNGLDFGGKKAAATDILLNTKLSTVIDTVNNKISSHSGVGVTQTNGADLTYQYTGRMKNAKIDMYDYLSDEEIAGQNITKSRVTAYNDPYTIFNTAVSNGSTVYSSSNQNVTFLLRLNSPNVSDARIFLKNINNTSTFQNGEAGKVGEIIWPGYTMKYDGLVNGKYQYSYTIKYSDIKDKDTNQSFDPRTVLFSGRKNDNTYWQTADSAEYWVKDWNGNVGQTHTFTLESSISGTSIPISSSSKTEGTAKTLYNSQFSVPLYFGSFLKYDAQTGNTGQEYDSADVPESYTAYNTPDYNNFYWQANLALRKGYLDTSTNRQILTDTDAAVLGLVDRTLTNGNVTQNGSELPYFSSTWANSHKYNSGTYGSSGTPIMESYERSGENIISFPFYEVLVKDGSNNSSGSVVKGATLSSGEYARFYQFNAKDTNLYFNKNTTTPSSSYFSETVPKIASQNGTVGFFPFNSSNSENGQHNNLGFGAKFEMNFKLSEDGTVEPVDENGKKLKTSSNRLHTMFEFIGDDDLWVFVDGNLMLDMGGSHSYSSGLIDFYIGEQSSTVNSGVEFATASGNDLNVAGSAKVISNTSTYVSGTYFKNILKEGSYTDQNGNTIANSAANSNVNQTKYNPNVTHTMTIFYMERGMIDSNLLIRFNYALESNFSKMKVQEVTDFSKVNVGLRDITRKAAEKDVFKYIVANAGTASTDVNDSLILYPTYDKYDRTYTPITGYPTTTLTYDQIDSSDYQDVTDTTSLFLNTGFSGGNWNQDNAVIAAWIWKGSGGGNLYIGKKARSGGTVQDSAFMFTGFPSDATGVKFLRLDPAYTYENGSGSYPANAQLFNSTGDINTALVGQVYQITGWNNSCSGPTANSTYTDRSLKYNTTPASTAGGTKYNPTTNYGTATYTAYNGNDTTNPTNVNAKIVNDVNYLWVDELTTQDKTANGGTEDDISGMTGRTGSSGELYLMHGVGEISHTENDTKVIDVAEVESSAEFERQFKRGSRMVITQDNTLYQPTNNTPATFSTGSSASTRTVSKYYSTTVSTFDRGGNTDSITPTTGSSDELITDFTFNNDTVGTAPGHMAVDPGWSVMMTEVFTNTVEVGAVSVEKRIKYGETGPVQDHTFRLTLTDVMESGENVTDYSSIPVSGATAATLTANGEFTIHGTGTATITGIPVYTTYSVTEVTTGDYYEPDGSITHSTGQVLPGTGANNATPHADNQAVATNKRKVGSLTLSKSLKGAGNAGSSTPGSSTPFTLDVTFTAPSGQGVDLRNYLTGLASLAKSGTTPTVDTGTAAVTVEVSPSGSVVIPDIPYGTTVTVEEDVSGDSNNPHPTYAYTVGGSAYSQTIDNPATVVTVTNTYRQVTLTKKDAQDTAKILNGAQYALVKLKDSALSGTSLSAAAIAAFNSATASDYTTVLASYIDGYSGVLTTGTNGVTSDDGKIVVNDSMMTNGLRPGKYYFVELAAPTDYKRDNGTTSNDTGSTPRIFEIPSTVPADDTATQFAVTYYNERETGTLYLDKLLTAASTDTSPATTFTFSVVLDGSDADLDLSQYGITGISGFSYDSTEKQYTGTITLTAAEAAADHAITGIPFGTEYTVTESGVPSGFVKVGESGTTGTIGTNATMVSNVATHTASVTNARTGQLVITKHLAAQSGGQIPTNSGNTVFTFHVQLQNADVDLTQCSLSYNGHTGTPTSVGEDATHDLTRSVSVTGVTSGADQVITISGIPYGTTYTVTEETPSDGSTPSYDANQSGTSGASSSTTVTNTYSEQGSLQLVKSLATSPANKTLPLGVDSATSFEFHVKLTGTDLTSYLSESDLTSFGAKASYTYQPTLIEFNVDVTAADTNKILNKIPFGTSYEVYETTANSHGALSVSPTESVKVTGTITSDSDATKHQTATITNTYQATGVLQLHKTVTKENTSSIDGNTVYHVRVQLSAPSGITLATASDTPAYNTPYIIKQQTGSSGTPANVATPASFVVDIKDGEDVYISGIPYGTAYTVHELTDASNHPQGTGLSVTLTNTGDSPSISNSSSDDATTTATLNNSKPSPVVTITNTYRDLFDLTLSKTLHGESNTTASTASFSYQVELTEPSNVTFSGNYPITELNGLTPTNKTYTFTKTVPGNGTAVISGIPYGTQYKVTELDPAGNPQVFYGPDGSPVDTAYVSGTITSNTSANVTNVYRKVSMTKTDAKNAAKTLNGATYVLLRLKDGLDTSDNAVKAIFAAAQDYTDLHPENDSANKYYSAVSTAFTTGNAALSFTDGQIIVRDSDMTGGLTDGTYFFFETSPAASYQTDNSLSTNKLITLSSSGDGTSYAYDAPAAAYTDPRQTGDVVLEKTLATGSADTSPASEFTYHVVLQAPTDGGVDLSQYGITLQNGTMEAGAAYGANGSSYTFDVKVTGGSANAVTVKNLPYGTRYKVTETSPSGWEQIGVAYTNADTSNTSDTKVLAAASETVTVTNARTGSLSLTKDLAAGTDTAIYQSTPFTYTVVLTRQNTGINLTDFIKNAQVPGVESLGADKYNDARIEFTVSVSHQTGVTIPHIPFGTKYEVTEDDQAGWVCTSITDTTNTAITADTQTVNAVNAKTGSLALTKTLGDNAPAGTTSYDFLVTLTGSLVSSYTIGTTSHNVSSGEEFTVTVGGNETVTLTGIPYGTAYTVVEQEGSRPTGEEAQVSGEVNTSTSPLSRTIAGDHTVNIRNDFSPPVENTLTLQKVDTSRSNALIITAPAQFVLMRLNGTQDWTQSETLSAFQTEINSAGYAPAAGTYVQQVYTNNGSYYSTGSNGQFVIREGEAPDNITFGSDYFFFYELTPPDGYQKNNDVTADKIFRVNGSTIAQYPNSPVSTDVTVEKQDDENNPISSEAEFDLYYKENITPPTYSVNSSVAAPAPIPSIELTGSPEEIPDVAGGSDITTYDYAYTHVSDMPDAQEADWILPRTDNDYIYFRDYNKGGSGKYGDHDTGAFGNYNYNNNTDRRYWLNTWLSTNEQGQSQEIFYDHEHHNYWFAAQFRKSGSSNIVQYAVWERFVDKYSDGRNTVVWKIQPPDGYKYVRFCLYDGDNCIRTTTEFVYQLGKVYTKTSWGGMYKYENGNDCYFNVPVDNGANMSSYYTQSNTTNNTSSTLDRRSAETTQLYQADRYEATPQKIVFQCNSNKVWHNIHIEFFTDGTSSDHNVQAQDGAYYKPVGQSFPGYMMEPYAHANKKTYRIDGYLTYELTIPADAKYFRVNNGVSSGDYYYRTRIQPLNQADTMITVNGSTKRADTYKNYFNYFKLDSSGAYNVRNDRAASLKLWSYHDVTGVGDNPTERYNGVNEIESDGEYVYFAIPASDTTWNKNHVYAYFYGGGDLRKDNWQRACYSIWPGVAPVSSEYAQFTAASPSETDYHSDIYKYSYTGSLYGNGSPSISNPETTFSYTRNGTSYKVYKFRVPQGDLSNYDHVIFNDGLKSQSGGHETEVIGYAAGTLYLPDRTADSHSYKQSTDLYDTRGDYLYIKMDSTTLSSWDDLHITFYNASGTRILQGGTGYVMKYAGEKDGETYFKIPVPADAKKFRLNNGYDTYNSSGGGTKTIGRSTGLYSVLDKVGSPTKEGQTDGGMVYTLSGTALTLSEPQMAATAYTQHISSETPLDPDTSPRGDFIFIRDDAGRFGGTAPVINFKNSAGTTITPALTVNKHVLTDGKQWYSVGIPVDAASFYFGTDDTTTYEVFAKVASGVTTGTEENFTNGGMYFKTESTDLTLLWPTFTNASGTTNYTDDQYSAGRRGDALYLVCADKDDWEDLYVIFYNESGGTIRNNASVSTDHIRANYIGSLTSSGDSAPAAGKTTDREEAVGDWFRVYIPEGAVSFKAFSNARTSEKASIYELRSKVARYHDDYTLGDMQYRLETDGSTESIYPVFTENPPSSMSGFDDITTGSILRANEALASAYMTDNPQAVDADVHSASGTMPVLYPTNSNTITYSWTEGTGSDDMLRFVKPSGWSTSLTAQFYNNTTAVGSDVSMSLDSGSTYKATVLDTGMYTYNGVVFSDGTNSTAIVDLTGYDHGKNYKCQQSTSTGTFSDDKVRFNNSSTNWTNVYVHFWNGSTESGTWYQMTDSDGDNIFEYTVPSGTYDHVRFSSDASATSGNEKTMSLSRTDGGKNALFTPSVGNYMYLRIKSSDSNFYTSKVYAYYSNSSSSDFVPSNLNSALHSEFQNDGNDNGNNIRAYGHFENFPSGSYSYVTFYGVENGTTLKWVTQKIAVSGTKGKGNVYLIEGDTSTGDYYVGSTNIGKKKCELLGVGNSGNATTSGSWTSTGTVTTWELTPHNSATITSYTYSYQPEDRYGLITDLANSIDEDNFIRIVLPAGVATPYIKFYSDTAGSSGAYINTATTDRSTKGLLLRPDNSGNTGSNNMKLDTTTYTPLDSSNATTATYLVRLPKNARSFRINNGTADGQLVALYEDLTVDDNGNSVTLTDYHHAGTTFTMNPGGNVTGRTYRSSTLYKSTIETPLSCKTDADYIFFTDVGGTLANDGKVYAYYYGGRDGAYLSEAYTETEDGQSFTRYKVVTDTDNTSWCGVPAQYVYTDNSNNRVYVFQPPKASNGEYPYVMFSNGSLSGSTAQYTSATKVTEAVVYILGKNYVSDGASPSYGTTVAQTLGVREYTEASPKATVPTAAYSTTATNGQYLFFVNNGSYNFGLAGQPARYELDDVHITFFEDADGRLPVGTTDPGYRMDRLTQSKDGHDVYRITIPNSARYFQINNGQLKTGVAANNNYRQSEIKQIAANGMYQFVDADGSTPANEIWENDTAPGAISELNEHPYYLDLTNEIQVEVEDIPSETYDIWLATVVTGGSLGRQKYIKRLRLNEEETDVDRKYLDHSLSDIYDPDTQSPTLTTVKVIKDGTYYWVETEAPQGYQLNEEQHTFAKTGTTLTPAAIVVNDVPEPASSSVVVLTKTAKDKTSQFDYGEELGAGYGYLLYQVGDDGQGRLVGTVNGTDTNQLGKIIKKTGKSEYYYIPSDADLTQARYRSMLQATESGTHVWEVNAGATDFIYYSTVGQQTTFLAQSRTNIPCSRWIKPLLTDDESHIKIENLPFGDYYLEEVVTPSDSPYSFDVIRGWVTGSDSPYCSDTAGEYIYLDRINNEFYYDQAHNRVTFSVGENNSSAESPLEITGRNEMTPAYIRLFEHINERREEEWGNPTFIFKIKQTHSYDYSYDGTEATISNATYTPIQNGREYIVALTVDDDGKITADTYKDGLYNNWWLETTVRDYVGWNIFDDQIVGNEDDNWYGDNRVFGLNRSGWLPVEPGKYTISRISTSRYEYVDSYSIYATSVDAPWIEAYENTSEDRYDQAASAYRTWYLMSNEDNPSHDGIRQEYHEETIEELEVLPHRIVDVHYYDQVAYYDKFSQVDTKVNKFSTVDENGVSGVKGIRIDDYHQVGKTGENADTTEVLDIPDGAVLVDRMTVPLSSLRIYTIMIDGTERLIDPSKLSQISLSYTAQTGDEASFADDFDFSGGTLTIDHSNEYANGVYTLTASYQLDADTTFTTTFHVVFERVSSP